MNETHFIPPDEFSKHTCSHTCGCHPVRHEEDGRVYWIHYPHTSDLIENLVQISKFQKDGQDEEKKPVANRVRAATDLDRYSMLTGHSFQHIMAGAHDNGPHYCFELAKRAVRERKQIKWVHMPGTPPELMMVTGQLVPREK